MKITPKRVLFYLIGLVLLLVLLSYIFRGRGETASEQSDTTKYKEDIKNMSATIKQKEKEMDSISKKYTADEKYNQSVIDQLASENYSLSTRIDRLQGTIKKNRQQEGGLSMGSDEMLLDSSIDKFQESTAKEIKAITKNSEDCREALKSLGIKYKELLSDSKKANKSASSLNAVKTKNRLQLWAGGGVIGSTYKPISGYEVSLMLKDRSVNAFEVGMIQLGNQSYAKVSYKRLITFKK